MLKPDWSKDNTMKRLNDPEAGDQFCEMCSFWVVVVDIAGDDMVVNWGKELLKMKKDEFFKKCCYSKADGSWLRYYGKCEPDLLKALQECVDEAETDLSGKEDLKIFRGLKTKGFFFNGNLVVGKW